RLVREPRTMFGAFTPEMHGGRRVVATAMFPLLRHRVRRSLGINESSAQEAWGKVDTACQRFAPTFRKGRYLVGDQFSVADLTLASLLAPIVAPEQYPYPQPQREHPSFSDLRRLLDRYGAVDWTLRTYARHRPPSAEAAAPHAAADRTSDF